MNANHRQEKQSNVTVRTQLRESHCVWVFLFRVSLAFVLLLIYQKAAFAFDIGKSTIQLIDGTTIEASVAEIDPAGIVSGEGIPAGTNIQQVLSLVTERDSSSDEKNSVSIHVVGGGQLKARDPRISQEKCTFQSSSGVTELPLQAARAIVWSSSELVASTLKKPSKENDTVIVETKGAERLVDGILESIDHEFVRLNYKGRSEKIRIEKVKAVIVADLGMEKPIGSLATIALVDQSRVVGLIESLSGGELSVVITGGTLLKINSSNIVQFTISSDRLVYLSDIDPIDVQEKAVFAVQRSWKRDRSVADNPMQIRLADSGKTIKFNKGLGTQASSRLVFENTNEFDRFSATAGIDAETKGRGDCQMVVRGDGIELWSQRVRGSDGPQEINVDITGMKEVVLMVYPGEEFDLGDHADWADARFLKTK